MNTALRRKYEAEQQRLDAEHADLQHHWQNVPRYCAFALLAPFVWYKYGFASAFVELMVTAALVGVRAYLIGVRMSENRWIHQSLTRELEAADADHEEPARVVSKSTDSKAGAEPLNHDLRYDSLVSADTRESAIAIAAEALPYGTAIVHVEATDVAEREGPDSWHVAIWFAGKFGRALV